ncbi:Hypothetical protein EUBREC_2483 [Agathobacter rectalis ATCC 33656]|uniref:Uncharacterized protein n=1 Tax=Agathobacter rectalis (strain ATCC 33656 / DSM 3377 / JCM 17463 / KCTC 5835 / VPI 0990) TaxID=515619 RepID=C4ZG08_AGARV|nr:Hypothetical protein EUBREC_2483 [Agathobacter rectalis ATCC 33656]
MAIDFPNRLGRLTHIYLCNVFIHLFVSLIRPLLSTKISEFIASSNDLPVGLT